jgi:hypothetical protein
MRSRRLLPLAAALLASAVLAGCVDGGGNGGDRPRAGSEMALPLVFLGLLLIVGVVLFVVNLNSSPLRRPPPPPPAWQPVQPPAEPNWFQDEARPGPSAAKRPAAPPPRPPAAKARRRQP